MNQCPVCENEELEPNQKYCQICGKPLRGLGYQSSRDEWADMPLKPVRFPILEEWPEERKEREAE